MRWLSRPNEDPDPEPDPEPELAQAPPDPDPEREPDGVPDPETATGGSPTDQARDAEPSDKSEPDAATGAAAASGGDQTPVDLGVVDPTELGRATRRAVARALAEDLGPRGDVTALATVPAGRTGRAAITAREAGVLFGLEVVLHVYEQVDTRVEVELHADDGAWVEPGDPVVTLTGPLASILTGERVVLNFLGHLSGIATRARRFVDAAGPGVAIRDTRKTTPGLRLLEKAAVRAGGGHNHRLGLYDALLIKDNHLLAAGSVTAAVRAGLDRARGRHVQVEVASPEQLDEALDAGATDILLDNFSPEGLREAVERTAGRAALEASGNVDLDAVTAYADTGVDRIAIGRLTHSTPWLDVALDLTEVRADGAPVIHAPIGDPESPERSPDEDDAAIVADAASGPSAEPSNAELTATLEAAARQIGEPADQESSGEAEEPKVEDTAGEDAPGGNDHDHGPPVVQTPVSQSAATADHDGPADPDGDAELGEPASTDGAAGADAPTRDTEPERDESATAEGADDDDAAPDEEEQGEGESAGGGLFAWRDRAVRARDGGPA